MGTEARLCDEYEVEKARMTCNGNGAVVVTKWTICNHGKEMVNKQGNDVTGGHVLNR